MAKMMYRDAVLSTIAGEMARDERVVVLGEDVVGGMGTPGGPEAIGGIWGTSAGLFGQFGAERVIDTPISESAIMGAAAGLALSGKRPVAELMFADFIGVSLDQIWNQIAKFRYMFGGKSRCPAVIRMAWGAGFNAAAQHSQAVHQILTGMPGLKVVTPRPQGMSWDFCAPRSATMTRSSSSSTRRSTEAAARCRTIRISPFPSAMPGWPAQART
jgi:acetoin:2,6-dichlorophenolindophenol oxidoreductase subunit beta